MSVVNVHDAKTHFSRLLDRAHSGEEIVLAKAGKPYARLVPLAPVREPGGIDGYLDDDFFADLPKAELDAWEQST